MLACLVQTRKHFVSARDCVPLQAHAEGTGNGRAERSEGLVTGLKGAKARNEVSAKTRNQGLVTVQGLQALVGKHACMPLSCTAAHLKRISSRGYCSIKQQATSGRRPKEHASRDLDIMRTGGPSLGCSRRLTVLEALAAISIRSPCGSCCASAPICSALSLLSLLPPLLVICGCMALSVSGLTCIALSGLTSRLDCKAWGTRARQKLNAASSKKENLKEQGARRPRGGGTRQQEAT